MTPDEPSEESSPDGDDGEYDALGEAPGSSVDEDATTAASTPDDAGTQPRRQRGPDEKFCPSCGEPIKQAAEICPECGVRQEGTSASSSGAAENDRTTAAIFALLLGGIGAHKFYLGKVGQGVLYLCFFWTLLPALVAFVEGIVYLTQSDEEFQRKHGA